MKKRRTNVSGIFEIQTDPLILTRRPDLVIIKKTLKKRTCRIVDFAVPANHRVKQKEIKKKKRKKKGDKYLDLARELKKTTTMEHQRDGETNCNWCTWYSHQRIGTGTGRLENKRTSGDHPKKQQL